MKHRVVVILLLLVAGAIVNVAVAWGCVWRSPFDQGPSGPVENDATIVEWLNARQWERDFDGPHRPVWFSDERGFGRRRAHLSTTVHVNPRIAMRAQYTLEMAGWPLFSMKGDYERTPIWNGNRNTLVKHGILEVRFGMGVLPVLPNWPGFAIKTVFYAAILWGLFAAPFALRRWRRIKRGLCPKCAYPVGTWGGKVCTECGAAVLAKPQRGASTTAHGNALGHDHAQTPKP